MSILSRFGVRRPGKLLSRGLAHISANRFRRLGTKPAENVCLIPLSWLRSPPGSPILTVACFLVYC